MKPDLECLELRLVPASPPLLHPAVDIVVFGGNAQTWVPLTQVMVTDYASLLTPYGVGQGTIAAEVSLPDPGMQSTAQVNATLLNLFATGQLPAPGPNTLVMLYFNAKPTGLPPAWAGFHDVLPVGNQSIRDTWVWTQPNESVVATHEFAEAASGQEIADPVDGLSFVLDGFHVSEFVLPGGSPVVPPHTVLGSPSPPAAPPSPSSLNLFALAVERLRADLFGLLARFSPAFAGAAASAAQAVAADPLHGTAQGHAIEMQADAVFMAWLQSL